MISFDMIPLIACGLLAMAGAIALGYFMETWVGAIVLFTMSSIASAICFLGIWFYGAQGLAGAVFIVAALAAMLGYGLSGLRGARCISLMWVGYCIFCTFGYQMANVAGLVMITLPSVVLFWVCVFILAQLQIPLDTTASMAIRLRAFRTLLTYALGTNYPYYAVETTKPLLRLKGSSSQFFTGPGIVVTGCDHTVVISDGMRLKRVNEPGFSFTGALETIAQVIDLRFQVRVFQIEALTSDGIRVRVLAQVPFRIDAGDAWPGLGRSFPFRKSAVFKAIQRQPVERSQEPRDGKIVEIKQRRDWDEMVSIVASRILRRIIGEYSFDDLCAPYQPQRDPRREMTAKFRYQLKEESGTMGIQVLGGSLGNLLPVDDKLLQQRIANWQAEWDRRIAAEVGKGEADYIRMVESARAQAQAEMIRTVSEGFERAGGVDENVATEVIALRFIEALERMIKNPGVQETIPVSAHESLEAIRRAVESQRH